MQELERGEQAPQPCGLNLERKIRKYRDAAVYSGAVNIALSHGFVV